MGIVKKTRGKVIIGDGSVTNGKLADDTLKEAKLNGAKLSGTVATAGTAVTVAHGLGSTPTMAFIVQGDAYVSSVDGTNVTVNSSHSSHDFYVYALL